MQDLGNLHTYPGTGTSCRRISLPGYDIDVIEGGRTAFFTFFAADIDSREKLPWGAKALIELGYTVIGLKGSGQDWYRGKELHDFLQGEEFRSFLAGFDQVVFYGASKGGYGALAFSCLVDNPIVISISPQSTLCPELVPFETRFLVGQEQDWSGAFRDSVDSLRPDGTYYIFVDPYEKLDRQHVNRLKARTDVTVEVRHLPFGGHTLPNEFNKMGLLKPIITHCADRTLSAEVYGKLIRKRRDQLWYNAAIAKHRKVALPIRRICLEKAREIAPDHVDIRIAEALIAVDSGELEEGARLLEALIQSEPTRARRLQRTLNAVHKAQEATAK